MPILALWWMQRVPSGYSQEQKYGSYWEQQLLLLTVAFLCNLGEFFLFILRSGDNFLQSSWLC